jgi:hypothetical protein
MMMQQLGAIRSPSCRIQLHSINNQQQLVVGFYDVGRFIYRKMTNACDKQVKYILKALTADS